MNVIFYYEDNKNDSTEKKIIFLKENANKNSFLSLVGKNVQGVSDKFDSIEYCLEDSAKTKKVDLGITLKIIYNGKADSLYTKDDFIKKNNKIKLLDNNTDGIFEVVFISSYETMMVNYASTYSKTIYNKFDT
jgi:hypothetical protein